MIAHFYVFHKANPTGQEVAPEGVAVYGFKTCLRHIYFAHLSEGESVSAEGFQVFRGRDAYQFILEVICGLHSPVIGETEVFGQFKNFLQNTLFLPSLQKVFEALVVDTKKIRKQYLTDIGGQSYGSLLRKMISQPAKVDVIGAGAFLQELLPWIYKDENIISVYARDVEKASHSLSKVQFPRVRISSLYHAQLESDYVVIAAPVSATEIHRWVNNDNAVVIDLRGESHQDPCHFKKYIHLNSFFEQIQKNQNQLLEVKLKAQQAILALTHKRDLAENVRPFGWDDLCAW